MSVKTFNPYPLQGYWGKVFGFWFAVLFLIAFIVFLSIDIHAFGLHDEEGVFLALMLAMCFGMFMMVFSREKEEDERVKIIRAKSMQIGYMIMASTSISMSFISIIDEDFIGLNVGGVIGILFISLLFYNLYFNYSLKKDPDFNYSDATALDNMRTKPGKVRIMILIALALGIILLISTV
jgi:hypothetical protein